MRRLLVFAAMGLLSACAGEGALAPLQVGEAWSPSVPYDDGVQKIPDGLNEIRGSALLRTVGGDIKTCGGLEVSLAKSTAYADERMLKAYGSLEHGYIDADARGAGAADLRYYQALRGTRCDAQGEFKFTNLADGTYYVTAEVTWGVAAGQFVRTEGGVLMARVEVSGGEVEEVLLTQR